jgi:hypothetical protein
MQRKNLGEQKSRAGFSGNARPESDRSWYSSGFTLYAFPWHPSRPWRFKNLRASRTLLCRNITVDTRFALA